MVLRYILSPGFLVLKMNVQESLRIKKAVCNGNVGQNSAVDEI